MSGLQEECGHNRSKFGGLRDQAEMPVVVGVESRVGKQAVHDARVDERDDGIVGSREEQRLLPDDRQERQACSPRASEQLVQVSPAGGRPISLNE